MADIRIKIRDRWGRIVGRARIDEADYRLSDFPWRVHGDGYIYRRIGRKCVLMHRDVLGIYGRIYRDGVLYVVDHINGDRTDNRRCNLRIVTQAQNLQSAQGLQARNKTGYRGVCWCNTRRAFVASVGRLKLGRFRTPERAALVAAKKRIQLGYLCGPHNSDYAIVAALEGAA